MGKLKGWDESFIDSYLYKISEIKINPKQQTEVTLTFTEDFESKVLERLFDLSNEMTANSEIHFKLAFRAKNGKKIVRQIIIPVEDIDVTLNEFDYNCRDNRNSQIVVKLKYSETKVEVFKVEEANEDGDVYADEDDFDYEDDDDSDY
jgi:hypothetical protein